MAYVIKKGEFYLDARYLQFSNIRYATIFKEESSAKGRLDWHDAKAIKEGCEVVPVEVVPFEIKEVSKAIKVENSKTIKGGKMVKAYVIKKDNEYLNLECMEFFSVHHCALFEDKVSAEGRIDWEDAKDIREGCKVVPLEIREVEDAP